MAIATELMPGWKRAKFHFRSNTLAAANERKCHRAFSTPDSRPGPTVKESTYAAIISVNEAPTRSATKVDETRVATTRVWAWRILQFNFQSWTGPHVVGTRDQYLSTQARSFCFLPFLKPIMLPFENITAKASAGCFLLHTITTQAFISAQHTTRDLDACMEMMATAKTSFPRVPICSQFFSTLQVPRQIKALHPART